MMWVDGSRLTVDGSRFTVQGSRFRVSGVRGGEMNDKSYLDAEDLEVYRKVSCILNCLAFHIRFVK